MPASTGDDCSKVDWWIAPRTESCSLDSTALSIAGAEQAVPAVAREVA